MARLLQRHGCCWTSVQHIVPRGLSQSRTIGCELESRVLASILMLFTKYPLCKFGGFFSCIVLFMLASTGSLLHDECNIACSLNYGAALKRGISEDVDKMNLVPRFLFLMNYGKCSNLHGRRYDIPYPCCGFSNTSPTILEMFIIVINILSGSQDLSDTRP